MATLACMVMTLSTTAFQPIISPVSSRYESLVTVRHSSPSDINGVTAAPAAPKPDGDKSVCQQSEYGKTLPLPDTYVKCGRCQSTFAMRESDLGDEGRGRRVSCSVCEHSWFQTPEKLFNIRDGFEMVAYPEHEVERMQNNLKSGRRADFIGVAKLYVGNLDFKCSEDDLLEMFKQSGDVGGASIVRDETGRSRGFAFVTMVTKEGGDKALELDGSDLLGRQMQVRPPNN